MGGGMEDQARVGEKDLEHGAMAEQAEQVAKAEQGAMAEQAEQGPQWPCI